MIRFVELELQPANKLVRDVASLMALELFVASLDDLNEEVEDFIRIHSAEKYTDYVLLGSNDELLGAASVIYGQNGEEETEVIDMVVRPELQRKGFGYGRQMLQAIAERAIARNNKIINLFCYDEDVLIGFYHKIGFTPPDISEPDFVSIDAIKLLDQNKLK